MSVNGNKGGLQEIERNMQQYQWEPPSRDYSIAILEKVRAPRVATASFGQRNRVLVFVAAAAALVLICLGFFWWTGHTAKTTMAPEIGAEIARISAGDRFYVLRCEPDGKSLLAQGFEDFTVKRSRLGAEIGGFVIMEIEENAFSLRDETGQVMRVEVGKWNQESLSVLDREVGVLKQLQQAGQLNDTDLVRLGAIARYGDLTALHVLKRIAAMPGDCHGKQAKQMLAGSNPEALALLLKSARDREHKFRQNVLKSLGKSRAIQGRIVLRAIAVDASDPCQVYAIRTLAESGDKESLPLLEKLYRDNTIPDSTRQAAQEAFEKLTK
ncbi:HEAT repeat domain-containing protein [Planctomycetota bacterium]